MWLINFFSQSWWRRQQQFPARISLGIGPTAQIRKTEKRSPSSAPRRRSLCFSCCCSGWLQSRYSLTDGERYGCSSPTSPSSSNSTEPAVRWSTSPSLYRYIPVTINIIYILLYIATSCSIRWIVSSIIFFANLFYIWYSFL